MKLKIFNNMKLNRYNTLYNKLFENDSEDVSQLITKIDKKYREIIGDNNDELFHQKVIIEEKIDSSFSLDMNPFFTAFVSIIITGIVPFFKNLNNTYYFIFLVLEFLCFYLIIFFTGKLIDTMNSAYNNSFYKICLRCLEKIEKELNNNSK